MADNNGNGGATRWMLGVWICLLIFVLGALVAQTSAVSANSERIARLEVHQKMVSDSLKEIQADIKLLLKGEGL